MSRWVYVGAAVVLALSLLAIRRATLDVARSPVVLATGAPALVFEPGASSPAGEHPSGLRYPALVLAHGWGGSSGTLSSLARAAARSGYLVIVPDLPGHGRSRGRFDQSRQPGGAAPPIEDVAAAVELARTHPRVDAQSVAVAGHGLGAAVALAYAARDPSVAATIALSGGYVPDGPYPPPNVLLLFGELEGAATRAQLRRVGARLAGRERVVLERSYGDPRRGTAVRVGEIGSAGSVGILYSRTAWTEVVGWLERTAGPSPAGGEEPPPDGRYLASGLGLVAFGVLMFGLAGLPGRGSGLERSGAPPSLAGLAALFTAEAIALLLLSAGDPASGRGPFGFLPIAGARELIGLLALSGGVLLVSGAASDGSPLEGLREPEAWLAGAGLFALTYLVLGALLQPFHDLFLTPPRLVWFAIAASLALPFFVALERALPRVGLRGVALAALARLVTLITLLAGALLGVLPEPLLTAAPLIALGALLLEALSLCLARRSSAPALPALYQTLTVAWISTATLPLV